MAPPYVGRFTTGTGAVSTTINLGVPFVPKAIIFMTSGATTDGDQLTGSPRMGYGFAVTGAQRAIAMGANNDSYPASQGTAYREDCCVLHMGNGSAIDGFLSLQSMAGGVVLEVGDQYATSRDVTFIALDVRGAEIGTLTIPDSTGYQTISGHRFQADAALFMWGRHDFTGTPPLASSLSASFGLGMATASASGAVWGSSRTADGGGGEYDYLSYGYGRSGECIAIGVSSLSQRASFVGFTADGFTLNWLERADATKVPYLLLKGNIALAVFDTPTNTSQFNISALADANGAIFMSALRPDSTADTPTQQMRFTVGMADGSTQRAVSARQRNSANINSMFALGQRSSRVAMRITDTADSSAREMQVNDIAGLDLQMSRTGVTSAFQVFGLAFWDEARPSGWWLA